MSVFSAPASAASAADGPHRSAPDQPAAPTERILIPVDTGTQSAIGITHALARRARGYRVEVVLVHAIEPDPQWQIRRYRSERELTAFREARAAAHCARLAAPLADAGIPVRTVIRHGEPVFAILDAAEEFDCQAIAVPRPQPSWRAWLFRDTVGALLRRARAIPVIPIGAAGAGQTAAPRFASAVSSPS
ncbi:MAG: universal stress protein [Burkholderiales bacterium]|nr:universal stress protein [Burkholderiales bacterium]